MAENQTGHWVDQMAALSVEFNKYIEPLTTNLARLAKETAPVAQALILSSRIEEATKATGWLPYRTVPYDQFHREGVEVDAFCAQVSCYYKDHSHIILQDIDCQLSNYDVDAEAKATLRETLNAHNHGLYRCVCRTLLPEMERVIREDWIGVGEVKALKQKWLEEKTNKHYLEDFILGGAADLVLLDLLLEDLFVWVKSREQVKGLSTVNRHAASHGWIPYSSMQYSMNSIICADYIFRMVTSFKNKQVDPV